MVLAINRHYQRIAEQLSIEGLPPRTYEKKPKPEVVTHPAIVVVERLNKVTIEALDYARLIADEIVAVHIDTGSTDQEKLQQQWQQLESDINLEIVDSPYRSVLSPLIKFIDEFEEQHQKTFSTVIVGAVVPRNWWESILHNQTAFFLKAALRDHKSRVVTTVRYYL